MSVVVDAHVHLPAGAGFPIRQLCHLASHPRCMSAEQISAAIWPTRDDLLVRTDLPSLEAPGAKFPRTKRSCEPSLAKKPRSRLATNSSGSFCADAARLKHDRREKAKREDARAKMWQVFSIATVLSGFCLLLIIGFVSFALAQLRVPCKWLCFSSDCPKGKPESACKFSVGW